MPARSEERTNARKEEIINACKTLYQTMSFKDITIKEIGNVTSFSRTSIYNYFETKEEIFLALLKREYDAWILDLHKIVEEHESLDDEEIMFGIYPYTVVTDKQKKAMEEAGVDYTYNSVYELTKAAIKKLLK